jgi:hypothetical protein
MIKNNFLKQIKPTTTPTTTDQTTEELNFIKRNDKLTNKMIRNILTSDKQNSNELNLTGSKRPVSAIKNLTKNDYLQGVTKLKKKGKQELKKNVWQQSKNNTK